MKHLICLFLFLSACTSVDDTTSGNPFSPQIPGGIGGKVATLSVSQVTTNALTPGQITLTWVNPSIYLFTPFKVHVFKRACYFESTSCLINAPIAGGVSAYQIYQGENNSIVDTLGIIAGQNYTYWIYVEKEGVFDTGVKIGVTSPLNITPVSLTDPNEFWQFLGIGVGSLVSPASPFSIYTMGSGLINPVTPTVIPGKTAFGLGGSIMYIADTNNNRVLVYGKAGAIGCESISDKNSDAYQACIFQYSGEPYAPMNVLGQPNQYTSKTCAEHRTDGTIHYGSTKFVPDVGAEFNYSKCLTAPAGVYVDGTNLIISDTGNDRLVVHKILPASLACDRNMSSTITTTDNCAADIVIGKQSFQDLNVYSVTTDGRSSLNKPTEVAAKDGNLYVLDSGNHRIVRVKGYASNSYWSCDLANWQQPLCSFSALLGQRNYFERKHFSDELVQGNITISSNSVSDATFLSKHFENPTGLKISSDNKLLVSSYENFVGTDSVTLRPIEMRSRILIFNLDIIEGDITSCNVASFTGSGCSATKIIGQQNANEIPLWSSSTGSFESQVSYGLEYVTDIELSEGNLIAVQPGANNFKIWTDWNTSAVLGVPYTYNVLDPEGTVNPDNTSQSLPDLESIVSVSYNASSKRFYINDSTRKIIYEVLGYQ